MALEFVGWNWAGSEVDDFAVDLTALTGGVDTAARTDDLVIIIEGIAAGADEALGVVSPSGYVEIAELYSDDSTDTNLSVSWKIMGATPDTSVTVTGASATTRSCVAIAYVWRGQDPTTPFDAVATTDTGANSQRFDPPAITTVTPNAVVIGLGANGVANPDTSFTTPTGYENDARKMIDNGSSCTVAACSKVLATPGTDDPPVWDGFGAASTASWCAVTLALRPAAAGGVTVTPSTLALTTAAFAPTVTASDHKTVTPTTAALSMTTFAPTVTGGAGVTVTPSTAALTLETFAPTVATTDHQTVTPGTAELTLTTFEPTVTGGAGLTLTPGTASLILTTFAPTVTGSEPVTPTETGKSSSKSSRKRWVVCTDEEILEEIQEEEKALAKEKKKLKILVKQAKKLPKTGILYRQAEERIERFEQKIDDRLAKIAELTELLSIINEGLEAIAEDDEEVLLLS